MFYVIKKGKERSWQYSGWNCASAAGGPGSIPDQSTKIPHGTAPKKGEKNKVLNIYGWTFLTISCL